MILIRQLASLFILALMSMFYAMAFGFRPYGFYVALFITLFSSCILIYSTRRIRNSFKIALSAIFSLVLVAIIVITRINHSEISSGSYMNTSLTRNLTEFLFLLVCTYVSSLLMPNKT